MQITKIKGAGRGNMAVTTKAGALEAKRETGLVDFRSSAAGSMRISWKAGEGGRAVRAGSQKVATVWCQ